MNTLRVDEKKQNGLFKKKQIVDEKEKTKKKKAYIAQLPPPVNK
jgi:hypothetical protein